MDSGVRSSCRYRRHRRATQALQHAFQHALDGWLMARRLPLIAMIVGAIIRQQQCHAHDGAAYA